jgi:Protein of unknown function (DUF1091)
MQKFECIPNKSQCKNLACNHTLINPFLMNLTNVGCTLTRNHRQAKVIVITLNNKKKNLNTILSQLRVRHEIKIANNRYKPGLFDTSLDFCDIFKGINAPIASIFIPNAKERLGSAFHACPYTPVSTLRKKILLRFKKKIDLLYF